MAKKYDPGTRNKFKRTEKQKPSILMGYNLKSNSLAFTLARAATAQLHTHQPILYTELTIRCLSAGQKKDKIKINKKKNNKKLINYCKSEQF